MRTKDINISEYLKGYILLGGDLGTEIRKNLNLDCLEEEFDSINIILPKNIWGLNFSFFNGMFFKSIVKYGNNFQEKYTFSYENNEDVTDRIKEDISYNILSIKRVLNY